MSGLSVTGSRRNATEPMNSNTTNSTTGVTGWRIAQAEMFFMDRASRRPGRGGSDLDRLAVAQEAAGGRNHALVAGQAFGDDHARVRRTRNAHRAAPDLAHGRDNAHVTAVAIGHDRGYVRVVNSVGKVERRPVRV